MDIFDIVFNPYFFVIFFIFLGLLIAIGPILLKKRNYQKGLVLVILGSALIFFVPYAYALLMWMLVNVFHLIP